MRIYTSENTPLDFCTACFPPETVARNRYGNLGDGPDDRGNCFDWDADHPPYDENGYQCCGCGELLRDSLQFSSYFGYLAAGNPPIEDVVYG